jgi:hypothetical protein
LIQCGVGLAFYFVARALLPHAAQPEPASETFWKTLLATRWELLLAVVHGGLVAAWLLRKPLLRVLKARF